jgi:hypothetical protein
MSSDQDSFTLFDLPDPALAEIIKHSRDRFRYLPTLNYQPFLTLARQGRDAVLRATRRIRLELTAADTDEAAVQPLARLLGRASGSASCEGLTLSANDRLHDQLLAKLFESCQPWSSVLQLDVQVCLPSPCWQAVVQAGFKMVLDIIALLHLPSPPAELVPGLYFIQPTCTHLSMPESATTQLCGPGARGGAACPAHH